MSFNFFPNFIFTKLLLMQTIRGLFLIVSSFISFICSLTQERIDINQPLFIDDEITFDSYTLNSNSQSDGGSVIDKINMLITELDANDLLLKPYVLSAL
jgi:hypothetical protein